MEKRQRRLFQTDSYTAESRNTDLCGNKRAGISVSEQTEERVLLKNSFFRRD